MTRDEQQERIELWQAQLRGWVLKLNQMLKDQNWRGIGPLATEIARHLPELDRHPEIRAACPRELTYLRQLHRQAHQYLSSRSQELERAMEHLRHNREGIKAYQEAQWL